MERTVKVLVVDDSSVIRRLIRTALERDPAIEVVGTAADPYEARDQIAQVRPDVVTLDLEMPRMDGITFLKKVMRYHPLPVVIISAHTPENGARAIEALDAGAVAVVNKASSEEGAFEGLVDMVKAAAHTPVRAVVPQAAPVMHVAPAVPVGDAAQRLVAIGASTGGTVAIEHILRALPEACPPIVITQHMPPFFTRSYAERLNRLCQLEVREAQDGDACTPGLALIAPGGKHLVVKKAGAGYRVAVTDGPLVSGHKPSVDVLLRSVAQAAGPRAIGLLLTGMGKDGAKGLLDMRTAGAHTLAQDEASCVVYGMPKAAVELDAASEVLPLGRMSEAVMRWSGRVVPATVPALVRASAV